VRRDKKRNSNTDFTFYPFFFWYQCCNCKREFRQEHGLRICEVHMLSDTQKEFYYCEKCKHDLGGQAKILRSLGVNING